jgi:hypothetical protein
MKTKTGIIAAVLVATSIGAALWVHQRADASSTPQYRLGSVERGGARAHSVHTGLAHLFMGSVAEKVVRTAACGVLTAANAMLCPIPPSTNIMATCSLTGIPTKSRLQPDRLRCRAGFTPVILTFSAVG